MDIAKEIIFKRDTAFRQDMFTPESFSHPAKMDSQLFIWLCERFTKPGDTILDPMFGSGTALLACTLGRNIIGVELEKKFVEMSAANWERVRQRPQLGYQMGTCRIIHGDARNLSGLIADSIITSPPYEASVNQPNDAKARAERIKAAGLNPADYMGGHGRNNEQDFSYSGKPDAILTSPPIVPDPVFPYRRDDGCAGCKCDNCGTGHYGLNDAIVTCRVTGTAECPGMAGDLSRAKPRGCKEREK